MYENVIRYLVKKGDYETVFIVARYLERLGVSPVSDSLYNKLEENMKRNNLLPEYTSRAFDDDPIPYDLISKFKLELPKFGSDSELSKDLEEEKSLSIRAIYDYNDAYEFFSRFFDEHILFNFSAKIDGINGKSKYIDDSFRLGLTRGRSSSGFDITYNLSKIIPNKVKGLEDAVIIGDVLYDINKLDDIRKKYGGDKYKTPKSTAMSLLRVNYPLEDYNDLHYIVYHISGVHGFKTKSQVFEFLKKSGFNVAPYFTISSDDVPRDFDEFVLWLDKLCVNFYIDTKDIRTDGVVVDIEDLDYKSEIKNQYSDRNIALKLSSWAPNQYTATVEDIVLEERRVKFSCRVKLVPIQTDDMCTATWLNGFNPDILINNNIKIGSLVNFVRDSGAVNKICIGNKVISGGE